MQYVALIILSPRIRQVCLLIAVIPVKELFVMLLYCSILNIICLNYKYIYNKVFMKNEQLTSDLFIISLGNQKFKFKVKSMKSIIKVRTIIIR